MAAGEGRRMRPVTLDTPKPLIRVNGIRMIDTCINALKENGIHEIYIVAGYKKEQFYEAYKNDPEVVILENRHYLEGNNITSVYAAVDYLPGSFILEGDHLLSNSAILDRFAEKSGYLATHMEYAPEWALKVENNRIISCNVEGEKYSYRLWGISMWTHKDGRKLAEMVRRQIEDIKDWSIYWDLLALTIHPEEYDLGIREIDSDDIIEIDTFDELKAMDPSYNDYHREDM